MQDVERAGAASEADRVPQCIARHARRASGPAERQELEVEPRSITERAQEPAHVPRRSRAGLHERRGVDTDLHSRLSCRSAHGVFRRLVGEEPEGLVEIAPLVAIVLGVERRLPFTGASTTKAWTVTFSTPGA